MKIQAILFGCLISLIAGQEFQNIVCSGFVEFPSDQILDGLNFSELEVHLYTRDGQLMEKTQCANNGFYLLPIYDLKDYIIKVVSSDQILQFKPQQLELHFSKLNFNEAKDICENQVNFKWSGFQLYDRVHIYQEDTKDIDQIDLSEIELEILDDSYNVLDTTKTNQNGDFVFNDILSGQYMIRPKQNQIFQFSQQNSTMNCSVEWPNGKSCIGSLSIQGFDIKGQLLYENKSLSNIKILLEPLDGQIYDLPNCETIDNKYICSAISQEDGEFLLASIPLGKYRMHFVIQPKKDDSTQTILEIEPQYIDFEVSGRNINLIQQLAINRLSIDGRVVNSRSQGIGGVSIFLDGQHIATSDDQGFYTLANIKSGVYTVEGQHEHLIFEPLNNLKISIGLKQVPNLQLKYLHLCGQINLNIGNTIQLGDDSQFSNLKIIVYLENQVEKSEKRTIPVKKSDDYKYCFEARPGQYLVYPSVSNQEKGKEIVWQPQTQLIDLYHEPQLDVNFQRRIVILGGLINFLQNTPLELVQKTKIRLHSIQDSTKVIQELTLDQIDQQSSTSSFIFQNILHGSYQVSIYNPYCCFQQSMVPLIITANSISDLQFKHSGYVVNYNVQQTLPITLYPKKQINDQKQIILSNNQQQRLCVENWEDYIISVDPCFQVDNQIYEYNISNPLDVFTTRVHSVRVNGIIKLGNLLSQIGQNKSAMDDLLKQIIINVNTISLNGKSESEIIQAHLSQDDKFITFNAFVKQGSNVQFTPQFIDIQNDQVENLLFEPRSRQILTQQDCLKDYVEFTLNTGFIFQGTFSEDVQDVLIKVYSQEELIRQQKISGLKFKLGPYMDSSDYNLIIEKDGFNFKQELTKQMNIIRINVLVEQLSTIIIKIVDEKQQALPNVMIFISTISKNNNIRINNQTNQDGLYQTNNLIQGDYMVKAFLKEYIFEPSSKTVSLSPGQLESIQIEGKKVAFSIFGKVQDFNKEGVENAIIEAYAYNAQQGSQPKETTITDQKGNYRIRGLEPNKKYQLKVKYENTEQAQTIISPSQFDLNIGKEDIYGKNFIMLQKQNVYLIQGRLLIDDQFTINEQKQFKINSLEVFSQRNLEIPLTNIKILSFHHYYEIELPEPQDVVVKIMTSKDKEKSELTQFQKEFTLIITKQQLIEQNIIKNHLEILKQTTSDKKQISSSSAFTPIWILITIVVVINFEKANQILQKLFK